PVEEVSAGVAQVDGDRVAVLCQERRQALRDQLERLVPRRRPVDSVGALDQRRADAIWIRVELLQRVPLGADEALAEDVFPISADRHDLLPLKLDLQAACRLT